MSAGDDRHHLGRAARLRRARLWSCSTGSTWASASCSPPSAASRTGTPWSTRSRPMWDGNETWLVLGGGGLFGVFPLAYSIIMPALYPVIFGMLFGLIFRGVAFELRFRTHTALGQKLWDFAFFAGSLVAALCQGLALGGLLQGIHVVDGQYAGGWFDWLTPFTVLCGVAVVIGYAWLGACWLIWRTDGSLQNRARRQAMVLAWAMLAFIAVVSVWTPFLNPLFMQRWFGWPGLLLTSPVPLLVALVAPRVRSHGIRRKHHLTPFLCALSIFVLCFAGLGIRLLPADGAARRDDLGRRGAAREPTLRAHGCCGADPADPPAIPASRIGCSAARCSKVPTITERRS